MPDLHHYWGGDLSPGATGDLQAVDAVVESTQRVLRRLLTNPGDYIWQPDYGAGLPSYIGRAVDPPAITALIKAQMYLEPSVLHDPEPEVNLQAIPNGLAVRITYLVAEAGSPAFLGFDVTPES